MMNDTNEQQEYGRRRKFGRRRIFIIIVAGLVLVCLVSAGLSALSNLSLQRDGDVIDRLSVMDKARLAETLHLKREVGDKVWPGWGAADIPVLLWNRDTSFLVGVDEAPAGWEEVADDALEGQTYYRRPMEEHQNFAVQIGDRWVASMATKSEADLFMQEMFRDLFPPPIEQIFPYRVLIQPSEVQMSGVLHESFHVLQMEQAPSRLEDAERAYLDGDAYWPADEAMGEAWQREIELLEQALGAGSAGETAALAGQFLDQRAARRQENGLSPALVAFERRFEWLEGLAKYVELESWRQAADTAGYQPLPAMVDDPDFKDYDTFDRRWSQEIAQMKRQATREGDTRFYYTGMAQANLLDRLLPDWKGRVMEDGVWLEDLLQEAVELAS